jgi:hypothetical protein
MGPGLHEPNVPGPVLERFVAGRSAKGFFPPCLCHNLPEDRPNSRRLPLLVKFRPNTLDDKSSTGYMSSPFSLFHAVRYDVQATNIDVKPLAFKVVSEIILGLSMLVSDSCPLSAFSIAVGISRTAEGIVSSTARVPAT